jgi:mono/diheme cytochrome c family protein
MPLLPLRPLLPLALLLTPHSWAAETGPASAFFSLHCNNCHGEKKQKGDLRVDTLTVQLDSPKTMAHWEEIMNRINSGDMPPEDEPRPKPEEIEKVASWIAEQLHEAETLRQSSPGERVTFHKLTREEYAHTVRDLLGVNFDVKGPTGLPEIRAYRLRANPLPCACGEVSGSSRSRAG